MSDSRLRNYALTAGGTAALAATSLAGADIQQSTGATTILLSEQYVDLLTINGTPLAAAHYGLGNWSIGGSASVSFGTSGSASAEFAMVNAGDSIGTAFSGDEGYLVNNMVFSNSNTIANISSLELGTGKIVGFSLTDSGGETYYGWIDYTLSMFEGEYTFTINGWAYNDVANQGIIAGQNTAAGSAVPGLGGLAALAIGAAGVRSRRQRTVA